MAKAQKKSAVKFRFYPTYNYGGDHDPAIDALKTAAQDGDWDVEKLSGRSSVSKSTINKWWDGQTISPRHATLAAVAGAMGKRYVLIDILKVTK